MPGSNFNHNAHITTVLTQEAPAVSGGAGSSIPEAPRNPNRKKTGIIIGALGGVAAVALAGALVAGGLNSSAGEKPAQGTERSGPADPTETAPDVSPHVAEIPTGLSNEEVSKRLINNVLSSWQNEGAEDSLLARAVEENRPLLDIIPEAAAENSQKYADELLVNGWESDTELSSFVTSMTEGNRNILTNYFATFEEPGQVAYTQTKAFESVTTISEADGERTLSINYINISNAEQNSAESIPDDRKDWTIEVTLVEVDGQEKISALKIFER